MPPLQCSLLPDSLSHQDLRQICGKLLIDHLGGDEDVNVLVMHHGDGLSVREIASKADRAPSAVHRSIKRTRARLDALGLLPEAWRKG